MERVSQHIRCKRINLKHDFSIEQIYVITSSRFRYYITASSIYLSVYLSIYIYIYIYIFIYICIRYIIYVYIYNICMIYNIYIIYMYIYIYIYILGNTTSWPHISKMILRNISRKNSLFSYMN